jgi:hypothetical protein
MALAFTRSFSSTGAAAERGRLVIGLFLGDPERGAITRDAPLLRLLYGDSLY